MVPPPLCYQLNRLVVKAPLLDMWICRSMPFLPTAPVHINPLACLEYIDRIQSSTHKWHGEATTATLTERQTRGPWKGKLGHIQMLGSQGISACPGKDGPTYLSSVTGRFDGFDSSLEVGRRGQHRTAAWRISVSHRVCMPPTRNTIHYRGAIIMLYGRSIPSPSFSSL